MNGLSLGATRFQDNEGTATISTFFKPGPRPSGIEHAESRTTSQTSGQKQIRTGPLDAFMSSVETPVTGSKLKDRRKRAPNAEPDSAKGIKRFLKKPRLHSEQQTMPELILACDQCSQWFATLEELEIHVDFHFAQSLAKQMADKSHVH